MSRGRPRKVETEQALHAIMRAFWQNGFKATSMNDLVDASGMAKPGLYAAFGDKEAMFEKSLLHYFDCYGDMVFGPLTQAQHHYLVDLRELIRTVGYLAADDSTPMGCFLFNSQVEAAYGSERHKTLLKDLGSARIEAIRTRLLKAVGAGEITGECDTDALATFIDGQLAAVSILARCGGTKAQIDTFVETAMKALPSYSPEVLEHSSEFTLRQ
ncbi:TetR/AcrR family transcriptional regulator [Roseibium denhamense]|uniref:Transcriptional regulator, TetR family n=2 Tax=Roseibium denhamense TaxID=76305 RepID=A0ABY1NIE3_9HYPH|nr:TetR/AcrR family transcriptional regulator [Roseibium denhamense]SMP10610.1 transcriptional regulator, TetR family [Roseibium denhamense]